MKRSDLLQMIDQKLMDRLYWYCYVRTSCGHEAETLCSDILYALIRSCRTEGEILNPSGYFWSVAHHVYADYCQKRHTFAENHMASDAESLLKMLPDLSDESADDRERDRQLLQEIYRQIGRLSYAYRQIMIGYYLDGKSTAELALELSVSEAAVRQRLFSARNDIRKGVSKKMSKSSDQKPVAFQEMNWAEWGTGNPCDGDPREVCQRQLSKHVIWLCRKQPNTARKISEELGVPMPYIEEELALQVHGTNGRYGMLRKNESGKYETNVILLDEEESREIQRYYTDCIPMISDVVAKHIEENREAYLAFPYLNHKPTLNLILWQQVFCMATAFSDCVTESLKNRYMSDIQPAKRPFTVFCYQTGKDCESWGGGWDGTHARDICGYSYVSLENIYIRRIRKHFHCDHNISNDDTLRMAIRTVEGIDRKELTTDEKEIAAKAMACGYLYREGDILFTKFLVTREEDRERLFDITGRLCSAMPKEIADGVAGKIAEFIRTRVPEHLWGDYLHVNSIAGLPVLDTLVEYLIEKGLLTPPENGIGAEGIWMSVKR